MKREAALSVFIAALSIGFVYTNQARALNSINPVGAESAASASEENQATHMVAAKAVLRKEIDANKVQTDQQFEATLSQSVQLKNGPELPRGTELLCTVVKDEMPEKGKAHLVLRISQARLKGGEVVPIKATIVSLYDPADAEGPSRSSWTPDMLHVEQERVVSGVSMHSEIGDQNSAVFSAKKKDDVRLPKGFGINLAIAAAANDKPRSEGSKGGS